MLLKKRAIALFVTLLLTNAVCAEEEEAVVAMTDDTFDDFIAGHDYVLAEFYAPWCGHCKNLAPEFEKAAKELLSLDTPVHLVKIDATVEKKLGERFEVQGYPTLKFFHKGKPEEYDGPRDASGIVEYCKEHSDPNYKPPPESVVTLTSKEELDDFVKSAELTLVEFYAPWCGHCKKLAPEYEKAAKELLEHTPIIRLAKVDATEAKELAEEYEVSGFPTIFMFRAKPGPDGEIVTKKFSYEGPRDQNGIVSYLTKHVGEAAVPINTLKELKQGLALEDINVVGMFSSKDAPAYTKYQESVDIVREKYNLQYTTSDEIRSKYGVAAGVEAIVVILPELMVTKYDKPFHVMEITEETENPRILGFIDAHETPLIGTRSTSNKERYEKRPLCVLFVPVNWSHEYRQMTASWRDKLLPIANKYRKDFHFAMSDDESNDKDMKSFGFEDSGSDFSFGCFNSDGNRYPLEELDEWEEDEIEEFLEKVKNGKARAYLRSQIPPKKQTKPVLTVTGKTFHDIVMDETKDVLIELYAPWCGHCKKFEPEYKKLAKSLANEKNLVLAKMNADANDGPDNYNVLGYPTIYFAPANNKEIPIKYEGKRELDDLKKFMMENAAVSFQNVKDEL